MLMRKGNSWYHKTDFGEFYYLNSSVDASVLVMKTANHRYNTFMADRVGNIADYYFMAGGGKTRKFMDLSDLDFIDSVAFEKLKNLQCAYPELKFIAGDEVLDIMNGTGLGKYFSLAGSLPGDVRAELESLSNEIGLAGKPAPQHSPLSQYSAPAEHAPHLLP